MKKIVALALVAALSTTAAVFALVTYDPESGGYAGKGDVQNALGLKNNATFQAVAGDIEFRYSDDIVVEGGRCLNPNTDDPHPNDVWRRTFGVSATLDYSSKNVRQVSGFILHPAGSDGDVVYTDSCGGNRVEGLGTILDVQPGAGLEVSLDGVNWVALPNS